MHYCHNVCLNKNGGKTRFDRVGLLKTGSRSRHTSKYLAKGRNRHILRPVSIKQVHEDVMAF